MLKRIPLTTPDVGEAELRSIRSVIRSGMLTEGKVCAELERRFADHVGCRYAVASSSCTSALHLALVALGIGPGDEVIVPDFTFPATANAVRMTGASPVLVDIDLHSYNIDDENVKGNYQQNASDSCRPSLWAVCRHEPHYPRGAKARYQDSGGRSMCYRNYLSRQKGRKSRRRCMF